jgi:hypothetical protein
MSVKVIVNVGNYTKLLSMSAVFLIENKADGNA